MHTSEARRRRAAEWRAGLRFRGAVGRVRIPPGLRDRLEYLLETIGPRKLLKLLKDRATP